MLTGDIIRERRKLLHLSQVDLSRRTGLTQPTISSIERGKNNPSYETIRLISAALNMQPSDLIDPASYQASDSSLTYEESSLLSIYRQLNSDGKLLLMETAESFLSRQSLREVESIPHAE